MGRKKIKEEISSSVIDVTESKEISHEDIEDEDRDRRKILDDLIANERIISADQSKSALENEKEECLVNSYFMYSKSKRIQYKETKTDIEYDIDAITKLL
ncbi:hypothetical protein COBT_000543 [Conglomerata obtusa]